MTDLFETVKAPDYVEYFVFPTQTNENYDQVLQEVYTKLTLFVNPLAESYIWQKDSFNIKKILPSDTENVLPHLYGITHYGENIEDEWFIVYLLLTFSERCKEIIVRIADVDGDFLLIEAAEDLPKWIKSENSNYSSYIIGGVVRIFSGTFSTKRDSVQAVITTLHNTKSVSNAEDAVTKTIRKKTKNHNLDELLHKSRVYLPVKVAALLDAKPGLIAHAVTTYCERDPIDERICRKMEHFPPNDMVLRLVTFTKFLYAMISHQKLSVPRNRSAWNLPLPTEPDYKERSLGYKITCGFEILASKSNKCSDDLSLNKKWIQYNKVLKNKGYFKNLLEGSKEYIELEKKARIYFLDNMQIEEADSNNVLNMLQTVTYEYNKMKEEESNLPSSDDEKWMDVDENELNKILEEQFGIKGIEATNAPEILSSAINEFLNRASDVDGVDLEKEQPNDSFIDMDIDEDSKTNHISFDPEGFVQSVEKMFDIMTLGHKQTESESESDSDFTEDADSDDDSKKDSVMQSYMDLMDKELQSSVLSESFVPKLNPGESKDIDVDTNMLTNMLKSYEEQYGGSGPAGNLLHSIGLRLDTKKE